MSDKPDSFSADWLALREPVDHAARDRGLAEAAARRLAGLAAPRILDLGCGSGSNLRGFAPYLGPRQSWTLVDHDPALLAAARKALGEWADAAKPQGESLVLYKQGSEIVVDFVEADLASDPARILERPADLVTAAALFDLVSDAFLDRFCAGLVAKKLPLYTVLIYDGEEYWSPGHEAEKVALAAFHAHQKTDKSFGPALGPDAADVMARKLKALGYAVSMAESPWRLGEGDAALIRELAKGSADAVAETGALDPQDLANWREARMAAREAVIGHKDLLAFP